MVTPVIPRPGAASQVYVGGTSVVAIYPGAVGGYILNPSFFSDQGIPFAEPLYVDPTGPAALQVTATTIVLKPGEVYQAPPGSTQPVWVNAVTSYHRFVSVVALPPPVYPPVSTAGAFPPPGPTTQTTVLPSYLYQQYTDDDSLQAFVYAYNTLAQNYIDTLNALNLPVYTLPLISGALLDWVGAGIYGLPRPALASGFPLTIGELNTWELNTVELNADVIIEPNIVATTDDFYKRMLTWHVFKGDGKVFNVRWLKRRVMRFLIGVNGTNPQIDQTNQISVTFGPAGEVSIRFIDSISLVTRGQLLDTCELNTLMLDDLEISITQLTPLPNRVIFKEAIDSGALETPFQFNFEVTV